MPASPSAFCLYDPHHTDPRWVEAQDLRVGDSLLLFDEQAFEFRPVAVEAVEPAVSVDTYDLTVDSAHEFFADSILVHNCLAWVYAMTGKFGGIPLAKDAAVDCNSTTPKPGEVFIDTGGSAGHAGFVYDQNNVLDSNWGEDEMIRIHPLADVIGYGPICYVDLGAPFGGATPSGGGGENPLFAAARAAIQKLLDPFKNAMHAIPGWAGLFTGGIGDMIANGILNLVPSGGGKNGPTGNVNIGQLGQVMQQIGWNPTGGVNTAACIVEHESGGNAASQGPGSTGWFQIQVSAHPEFDASKLTDPTYNTWAAQQVYNAAGGWGPWTTHSLCGVETGGILPALAHGGVIPGFCEGGVMGLGCGCAAKGNVLPGLGAGPLVPQLFDRGGTLMPGLTMALNNTGSPEPVGAGAMSSDDLVAQLVVQHQITNKLLQQIASPRPLGGTAAARRHA